MYYVSPVGAKYCDQLGSHQNILEYLVKALAPRIFSAVLPYFRYRFIWKLPFMSLIMVPIASILRQ